MTRDERMVRLFVSEWQSAAIPAQPAPGSELPNRLPREARIFYASLYPMGRQHEREGVSLGYPRNRVRS